MQELSQDAAVAHYNLGVMYMKQAAYSEAANEFEYALTLNPSSPSTHYNLAVIYETYLKYPDRAIRHYEAYVRLLPQARDAKDVEYRLYRLRMNREKGVGKDLSRNSLD